LKYINLFSGIDINFRMSVARRWVGRRRMGGGVGWEEDKTHTMVHP